MAVRVPPALNLAVLCSEIVVDADGRPFALNEPLYALSILPDERGRLPSAHFAVYVQLDDELALGTFWITAEVRTAGGFVLPNGRSPPFEITFSGSPDPSVPTEVVFDYRGRVFPEPGRYYVHVICNHMSLHSRSPISSPRCLRVLPRERPSGG